MGALHTSSQPFLIFVPGGLGNISSPGDLQRAAQREKKIDGASGETIDVKGEFDLFEHWIIDVNLIQGWKLR